jgi:uncharacterized damage-inducible protein DinB
MGRDIDLLRAQLRHAVAGDPWHGSPIARLLDGLTASQAAAKPIGGAHSIWELALHLASWQGEVAARVGGRVWSIPDDGDWPEVGEVSEARWSAARERLETTRAQLDAALAALPEEGLNRRVGSERDPAMGSGVTLREAVLGIVQHHAYHGGQIALLRRALGVD